MAVLQELQVSLRDIHEANPTRVASEACILDPHLSLVSVFVAWRIALKPTAARPARAAGAAWALQDFTQAWLLHGDREHETSKIGDPYLSASTTAPTGGARTGSMVLWYYVVYWTTCSTLPLRPVNSRCCPIDYGICVYSRALRCLAVL